jgi:hypothetical protein
VPDAHRAGLREKAPAQSNEGIATPSSLIVDNLITRDKAFQHVVKCRRISGVKILKKINEAQRVTQGLGEKHVV